MNNSSPFSATHHHPFPFYDDLFAFPDQLFNESSGGAFHAPSSSSSIPCPNHRPSGQLPHIIGCGGCHESHNYNNLPDQPPSSTTFQPGKHVEPIVITDWIQDYSNFFDLQVDQDGLYSEAKQMRPHKKWTHEETSKLLGAIEKFVQSRYMWADVKKNHFNDDLERSTNSLKQKFKEMCKPAATSSGKDYETNELHNRAHKLHMRRGEIQQKKCFKK